MVRRMIEGLVVLVALLTAATLGAARLWPQPESGFYWRIAALMQTDGDLGPVDFVSFQRRNHPSDALTCPERVCQKATPDDTAPIFEVPAAELRRKVGLVAEAAPNTIELPCPADCGHAARYVQFSAVFRFPDVIDVRVMEAGAKGSTLAIYSRSVVGYGDWGVNKARIESWIEALKRITSPR